MNQINIKLNLEEVNLILQALGQLPYMQVHELVHKIQAQAEPQVKDKVSKKER